MKSAKCTSCGANLEVDETKDAGICPFCNSAYVTEKAIKNFSNVTNNNATTIINNYYGVSREDSASKVEQSQSAKNVEKNLPHVVDERPKINWFIAILGLLFYFIPGILYIAYVKDKQYIYDKNHNKQ